jgi:HTH-type transcriptional regulator / antitoxin HipB
MTEYTVRIPAQLPDLLRGFRKNANLTQIEVAMQLGLTQQTLSAMERHAAQVSVGRLLKLLDVLGVELVMRPKGDFAERSGSTPIQADKAAW